MITGRPSAKIGKKRKIVHGDANCVGEFLTSQFGNSLTDKSG